MSDLVAGLFSFLSHYERVTSLWWEGVPERLRQTGKTRAFCFEREESGRWSWKLGYLDPGWSSRIEGRVYVVIGAETKSRDRIM